MKESLKSTPKKQQENSNEGFPFGFGVSTKLPEALERALVKSGMSYGTFVHSITQNAFRSLVVWSESDLERLLLTCETLGLSPLGRDVYALQSGCDAGALIAVGVEGWSRIINQHPQFDGMEFSESTELECGVPIWISCTIHRRDRRVALSVKEYLCEVVRDTTAWKTHPRRMLRHKAMVQCARLAFELPTSSGIYDIDEADQVSQSQSRLDPKVPRRNRTEGLEEQVKKAGNEPALNAAPNPKSIKDESPTPNELVGAPHRLEGCSNFNRARSGPSNTQQVVDALTKSQLN